MGFVLYRASAGSGKTHTLVKEYLKIVLKKPEKFNNILAITFTNKAAGEMKNRIIQSLKKLSKGNDPDLERNIQKEIPQVKNIKKQSKTVLKNLLHNYSDFAVTTIDSFIFKLINAFALELDLPVYFDVDLNYEKIDSFVVEKIMSKVGKDEYLTDIILNFVFSKIRDGKSWNIEEDIRKFEKQISNEKNINWVESIEIIRPQVFYSFIEELQHSITEYTNNLKKLGKKGLEMVTGAGLGIKHNSPAAFLKKTSELKIKEIKNFFIYKSFFESRWYPKSAPSEIKSSFDYLLDKGLLEIRKKIIELYNKSHSLVLTASAILDTIYLQAIVNQIKGFIDEYKTEYNVIPIYEFYIKFNKIVKMFSIPFIYSILGEKYNHYLIDEFQDTSTLQWENLFPLIENAMGYNFFNMAVGDGKQSIYRWRGGDVEIMEKELLEKFSEEQIQISPLNNNFRSRKNIVDFNNRFFEKIKAFYKKKNPLLEKIYNEIFQYSFSKTGGFVSLEFINHTEGIDTDIQVFDKVNEIIKNTLARNYQYSEICILVREKKEGQRMAQNLLEKNFPVISPDSLLLTKIPLIQFLIDVMRFLITPSDKIIESSLIYFLTLYQKNENIDLKAVEKSFLSKEKTVLFPELSEFFSRKEFLIRMPLYELIEEVIRIFNLSKSLNFNNSGYLQAFLDIVSEYSSKNSDDILSFLDWWEFNKGDLSINVPEIKNAIKIMTIHKAKGLEFPIVIIPFADWKYKFDNELWMKSSEKLSENPISDIPQLLKYNKKLMKTYFQKALKTEEEKILIDNINLMYVAFTRAIDGLYILSEKKNKNYLLLSEFASPLMKSNNGKGEKFTYGESSSKEIIKRIPEVKSTETHDFISSKWYSKISIRKRSEEFWRFDKSDRSKKINWGILLHQILSNIKEPSDINQVIEQSVRTGTISEGEKEEIKKQIEEILEINEVKEWFNPKHQIFIESPIITREGIFKPDRVIITDNRVIVVDFKTGEENDKHIKQIRQYKNLLKEMGYTTIEAILFYLKKKQTKKV